MTTLYFKVLGNIKHNGATFDKGSVIEGELATFQPLLEDGVLAIIDGAETREEAEVLAGTPAVAPEVVEEVEPENTWGPKPDEPETDDNATPDDGEVVDVKIGNYRIIGEAPYTDENGDKKGTLEIGTIYELPIAVGDAFVADGIAEIVPTDENGEQVDAPVEENK